MSKRIIICCDGTGNEIDDHHSNVMKLCRVLKKSDQQLVYYDPGLGTLGAHNDWARTKQSIEKVAGLVLGYGLDRNVLNAYQFLVDNYQSGDTLYFYGFSRGAYTVRVLAGFINAIGLLRPEQSNLCPYAYTAYKQIDQAKTFESIRLYEQSLRPQHPSIRFLGLWDTVSSIIVPRKDRLFIPSRRRLAFTASNPSVQSVRHALALDERRTMFQPYLWNKEETYWGNPFKTGTAVAQDLNQTWFAGVHSDIGGGYKESASGLAKITLDWMIQQSPSEIEFVTQTVNQVVHGIPRKGSPHVYSTPNPLAKLHDSFSRGWRLIERLPKWANQKNRSNRNTLLGWYLAYGEARVVDDQATIHESVQQRIDGCDYLPTSLSR